jgi:hypothetical protein
MKMAPEGAICLDTCEWLWLSHRLFADIPKTGFLQGSNTFFADF